MRLSDLIFKIIYKGLRPIEFATFLADFPRLEAIEAARFECQIPEEEILDAPETHRQIQDSGSCRLRYEVYLRETHQFAPLVVLFFTKSLKNGCNPERVVINLFRKNKHVEYGINNFRHFTIFNTALNIFWPRSQTTIYILSCPVFLATSRLFRTTFITYKSVVKTRWSISFGSRHLIEWPSISRGYKRVGRLLNVLSILDLSLVSFPLCDGRSEWCKIEIFQFSTYSRQELRAFANGLYSYVGILLAQVKGEFSPT